MKKRITFKVFACYYCKSLFILQVKNYNDHYDATDYKLNVLSFHNCLKRLKVKSALNPYPNETQQRFHSTLVSSRAMAAAASMFEYRQDTKPKSAPIHTPLECECV